jgi:hypothetical protein
MRNRTPKKHFLCTTSLIFAGALLALPLSPVMDALGLSDHAAFAAAGGNGNGQGGNGQGGNGNGNANGHGKDRGGPAAASAGKGSGSKSVEDALSPSEAAQAKNADKKAFHEAIKDLADLLGGRVNALHSLNSNGSSSNAASHSAAGLSAAYAEAVEALFSSDELEEEEDSSPTAGELLGSLANAKTTPEAPEPEDEEATDELSEAIQSLNDAIAGLSGEEEPDLSEEEQAAADEEAAEIADEIAEDTRTAMDEKESIGLGAVKEGLFSEEEDSDEDEES